MCIDAWQIVAKISATGVIHLSKHAVRAIGCWRAVSSIQSGFYCTQLLAPRQCMDNNHISCRFSFWGRQS